MTRSLMSGNVVHRLQDDGSPAGSGVHAGHAHEPGLAVDLGGAGAALAGLAIPAAGQVVGLRRLDLVDGVEDDHALADVGLVVLKFAGSCRRARCEGCCAM